MPDIANSRILVIGGAGFVGSHIVDQLLDEDVDRAAAHQPDVSGLLVGDAVAGDPQGTTGENGVRLLDERPLDAAAGHRSLDVVVLVDQHPRARIQRSRADALDEGRADDATTPLQPLRGDLFGARRAAHGHQLLRLPPRRSRPTCLVG